MTKPSAGTTISGKQAVVTENYLSSDGKTWYRKWSDGWKECGGYTSAPNTNDWYDATITFPVTFTSTPTASATLYWETTGVNPTSFMWIHSKTTTQLKYKYFASNNAHIEYYVCGY